ncbi:hypothetical protein GCM10027298_24710 [Epidermidibacterium keratini]
MKFSETEPGAMLQRDFGAASAETSSSFTYILESGETYHSRIATLLWRRGEAVRCPRAIGA